MEPSGTRTTASEANQNPSAKHSEYSGTNRRVARSATKISWREILRNRTVARVSREVENSAARSAAQSCTWNARNRRERSGSKNRVRSARFIIIVPGGTKHRAARSATEISWSEILRNHAGARFPNFAKLNFCRAKRGPNPCAKRTETAGREAPRNPSAKHSGYKLCHCRAKRDKISRS